MTLLVALLAYLIGSVQVGVLYSRVRGQDIRSFDAPGASGIYRRYGLAAALGVSALDLGKGALVGLLALTLDPQSLPLALLAGVLGHNYPLFFGFNGGAGILIGMGTLLVARPLEFVLLLGLGLALIPLYRATLQPRLKLNAVPVASGVALLLMLGVSAARGQGFWELLAFALGMGVRSVQLLWQGKGGEGVRG